MILALIKNNIIENVIVADSELIALNYPDYLVVRIDQLEVIPGIGWEFDQISFTPVNTSEE